MVTATDDCADQFAPFVSTRITLKSKKTTKYHLGPTSKTGLITPPDEFEKFFPTAIWDFILKKSNFISTNPGYVSSSVITITGSNSTLKHRLQHTKCH